MNLEQYSQHFVKNSSKLFLFKTYKKLLESFEIFRLSGLAGHFTERVSGN